MDHKGDTIRLYTVQHKDVVKVIEQDGACFSKKQFISKKYGESASVFLAAYTWLAQEAVRFAPKPEGAELHYWAFADSNDYEPSSDSNVLAMDVPVSECVFFNVYDWNKILRLEYIGDSDDDEKNFRAKIKDYGIKHDSDITLTNFYPDLKREILRSWQKLFRYHNAILNGERPFASIEAALWQIKKSWISEIK